MASNSGKLFMLPTQHKLTVSPNFHMSVVEVSTQRVACGHIIWETEWDGGLLCCWWGGWWR